MQHLSKKGAPEILYETLMSAELSDPAGILHVTSPFDQQAIAEVETVDATHVEKALQIAYALFRDRDAWISLHERVAILERTVAMMIKDHENLTLLATREGGKPLRDSQVEVTRAIDGIKLCIETPSIRYW